MLLSLLFAPLLTGAWKNSTLAVLQLNGEPFQPKVNSISGFSHRDTLAESEAALSPTHLVSQNSYGTGGRNLLLPKPHRGEVRRDPQHEHGGYRGHELPEDSDREHVRRRAADFYPSADAVKGCADEDDIPGAPAVQQPQDGEDHRDVGEQVDQGEPVYGQRVGVVKAHEYVANDAVLDPHGRVAGRDGAEDRQHEPAPGIKLDLRLVEQPRGPRVRLRGRYRSTGRVVRPTPRSSAQVGDFTAAFQSIVLRHYWWPEEAPGRMREWRSSGLGPLSAGSTVERPPASQRRRS